MEQIPHIRKLIAAIEAEDKEQERRYSQNSHSGIKEMKREGSALHPIRIVRQTYGYMDYPEINFRLPFPQDTSQFKAGIPVACFSENEDPIKGILLDFDGIYGEFRLFTSELPDWMDEKPFGLKLMPDKRTSEIMVKALLELESDAKLAKKYAHLLINLNEKANLEQESLPILPQLTFFNNSLNESQQCAVLAAQTHSEFQVIHGPPGTGKTTTLVEIIQQFAKNGQKVLVSAASNSAVDHIARQLIAQRLNVLRLGNTIKVDETVMPYTPEGKMRGHNYQKEIKNLKIRAEELRKMATQYKRRFGKDERDQRKLLLNEVKNIRQEIKDLQRYAEDRFLEEAQVVLGTPIGLQAVKNKEITFDSLIIDEAGQCLEPMAWTIIPLAEKIILAGDHWQLPPTVLSKEAAKLGLTVSILERWIRLVPQVNLLDTQYRMPENIAGFSNNWFYGGQLKSVSTETGKIIFIDTAGSDSQEKLNEEGGSISNETEADLLIKVINTEECEAKNTIVISPYAGQVTLLKSKLTPDFKISTVDSFQGQESDVIIISLVRSNTEGQIGFLTDYRRMNVALTRAKKRLFVIGDSSTIGTDSFFTAFLEYVEKHGEYRSIWEFEEI